MGRVAGYAAHFINQEISNVAVFKPCDPHEAAEVLNNLALTYTPRVSFIEKYKRDEIMKAMVEDMLSLAT